MKSFYINPATKDLDFDGQNNIKMVDGDDELVQCIREIIGTNIGEWFLNKKHGFDRFAILANKFNQDMTIDMIYAAISQEPGVSSIENIKIEYDRPNRSLSVDFEIKKANGEIVTGEVSV